MDRGFFFCYMQVQWNVYSLSFIGHWQWTLNRQMCSTLHKNSLWGIRWLGQPKTKWLQELTNSITFSIYFNNRKLDALKRHAVLRWVVLHCGMLCCIVVCCVACVVIVIWCAMCSDVFCCVVLFCCVLHCILVGYGVACMVWHGVARHGVVSRGVLCCDILWYGVVYCVLFYLKTVP